MRFLTSHGEKLVCAVVVILSAVWILQTMGSDALEKQKQIREYEAVIKAALDSNTASETYAYHPSKTKAYGELVKDRMNGAESPAVGPAVAHMFYPQPERPVVEIKVVKKTETEVQEASLAAFKGLTVRAQQGMVVLNCQHPEKVPNFVPVRIEIQRGLSPDKMDTPVTVIELGPEVAGLKTDDSDKKADPAEGDSADERAGTTARTIKRQPANAIKTKKDEKVKVNPATRFEDLGVVARTTYYYRARLVARLETLGPNNVVFRDGKEVTIVVPDNIEKVKGKEEGVVLYASPWSPVEEASIPANFQLRFNFVTGNIPADLRAKHAGYSVFLGVRLWDSEARAWSESSYEAPVGQPVKGRLKFKVGGATKLRDFDTGLMLERVCRATKLQVETKMEFVTEQKTDENGETINVPVMDADGKPKMAEKRIVMKMATEVAILKIGDTDKEIRLVKGAGYGDEVAEDVKIFLEGEPEPSLEDVLKTEPKPAVDVKTKPVDAKAKPAGH